MILASIIFLVFLMIIISGVWWLIKLDINTPDTEWTLSLAKFSVITRQKLLPVFNKMTVSMKEAQETFSHLAKYF